MMKAVSDRRRWEEYGVIGRRDAAVKDTAVTPARSPVVQKSHQCTASSALADAASANLSYRQRTGTVTTFYLPGMCLFSRDRDLEA